MMDTLEEHLRRKIEHSDQVPFCADCDGAPCGGICPKTDHSNLSTSDLATASTCWNAKSTVAISSKRP
jgi:Fe-S-cluster-containing hydrogenase component 2